MFDILEYRENVDKLDHYEEMDKEVNKFIEDKDVTYFKVKSIPMSHSNGYTTSERIVYTVVYKV